VIAPPSRPLFHSVAVGFILGYGPILLLGLLGAAFLSPLAQHMSTGQLFGLAVFLPIVLVLNAYLLSGFVMLGLLLFAKLRRGGAVAQ